MRSERWNRADSEESERRIEKNEADVDRSRHFTVVITVTTTPLTNHHSPLTPTIISDIQVRQEHMTTAKATMATCEQEQEIGNNEHGRRTRTPDAGMNVIVDENTSTKVRRN